MTRSAAAVRQADATLGPATSFTTSYTPNAVNQYAQIDPPQAIEVAGLTVPEVTQVSVNGGTTKMQVFSTGTLTKLWGYKDTNPLFTPGSTAGVVFELN